MKNCVLASISLFMLLGGCTSNTKIRYNDVSMNDSVFIESQISLMDEIIELHGELYGIHESLEKLYPIAVVNNGYFYVFDINELGTKYEFKHKAETDLPDDVDWLAAFDLESYDWKLSAVIGKKILENPENYVSIFHEFVHCFQGETVEMDIKSNLAIFKEEMAKQNYSWEINYPFPYDDEYFINRTIGLSGFLAREDIDNVTKYFTDMKEYLQETEFEYMIWQGWKEGFARYIENLLRVKLGQGQNTRDLIPPFNRVHFYQIGSMYIDLLIKRDSQNWDIMKLYSNMSLKND